MPAKIGKITGKGQILLPKKMREELGLNINEDVLIINTKDTILIRKIEDDFSDLVKHSEAVARKLWGGKEDDIWDTV
ncbi:MAG: AbrB/MazE/SpoVT family DNA-binding domain-containing protein [Candidatus Woesearchaeota archaeon]|nr:AbrB/MazE/SpoVT family DNA-binding domain-containing protein [Candidatus Woesearchaeota archaeon]